MTQYVTGEMGLVAASGAPAWIRIYAPKSFKPAPVAKVNDFSFTLRIKQAWENGPWVISDQHIAMSGSAMFKKFSQDTKILFKDFQPVAQDK